MILHELELDALTEVFWRKGYAGTGIDDLVAATGASRATLYQLYGDKRAMLAAALDHYAGRFARRVDAVLADQDTPTRDALAVVLGASADRLTGGLAPDGCLRCNSTLELAGRGDPVIDAALAATNAAFEAQMARLVARSVSRGEVAADAAGPLAVFLTVVVNGMVTLVRAGANRQTLSSVIDTALAQVGSSLSASSSARHS